MKAIYGLYADPNSAQRAVGSLHARDPEQGIDARDIVVASSQPFEEYDFGGREEHTFTPWLAALGGLMGGLTGFCFVAFTQTAYPLPTGGMPIVALWPDAIITYETTMLGVILATLLTLFVSARLPRWRDLKDRLYDPAIADGKILVGVLNPPEASRAWVEKTLREGGAHTVVRR